MTLPGAGVLNAATSGQPLLDQGPGGTWTNVGWATALLQNAGAPATQNNITNILQWMEAEEPPSDWWNRNNPLNASLGTSASDGTGGYPDLATGAQYTARMLQQSNMGGILAALRSNAPGPQFSAAVVTSPWAASHYGVAAAGAPPQYIVSGRGLDYLSTLAAPGTIPSGLGVTAGIGPSGAASGAAGGSGGASPGPTLFGIPATPPQVPAASANPLTDLSRMIQFGAQFAGWTIVTIAIFSLGATLMIAGGVAVGTVLIGPVAAPIAKAVAKKSPVGRAASVATKAARAASPSSGGSPSRSQSTRAAPARRSPPTAGRRESREIERHYRATERQQGPIGPRGGSATSQRAARHLRPTGPRSRTPANRDSVPDDF